MTDAEKLAALSAEREAIRADLNTWLRTQVVYRLAMDALKMKTDEIEAQQARMMREGVTPTVATPAR